MVRQSIAMFIKYPTYAAIVEFNRKETKRSMEEHKVEDEAGLARILERLESVGPDLPEQEALIKKAAYLLYSIVFIQPFYEGNKRTAYVAAKAFLRINGYDLEAPQGEIFELLEGIVFSRVTLNAVEQLLMERVRRR